MTLRPAAPRVFVASSSGDDALRLNGAVCVSSGRTTACTGAAHSTALVSFTRTARPGDAGVRPLDDLSKQHGDKMRDECD